MRYGRFPHLNRWMEFESRDDFEKYERRKSKERTWWQRNLDQSAEEFRKLIDKRSPEPAIHAFLEDHPYLLPGVGDRHHGPYEGIIATKLALGRSFITDFAFVSCDSQTLYFTCVEIESARKRLFRKDGRFHRDYLDARQQIADWLHWANHNVREAIDCWGALFNGKPASWYHISFRGFLVFGRREELHNRVTHERWSSEAAALPPTLRTMTYDRLLDHAGFGVRDIDNARLAVCSFRDRRFFVKRVLD